MYYLINSLINVIINVIINIFKNVIINNKVDPIYVLEYVNNPIYVLEKSFGGYCISITHDVFKFHKNISFVNKEKNLVATIILNDNTINLDAYEDLIFIGFEFTDLDFIIRSEKNIIFKGSMVLKNLDLKSLNFSFENLTVNHLIVNVSENLIGMGILHLQNSELNASFGIVLNQDATIIGSLSLKAKSIIISAFLGIGGEDLKIIAYDEFINYGTITAAHKIIFKGAGTFINAGKITSNDIFTLEAKENSHINVTNLKNATLTCLTESIIGISVNNYINNRKCVNNYINNII